MPERIQALLILAGVTAVLLVLVALGLTWLSKTQGNDPLIVNDIAKDAPEVEVQPQEDPEYGTSEEVVTIPSDRVPDTFEERRSAAPIELLPTRTGNPEYDQQAAIPEADKSKLLKIVNQFLPRYEKIYPGYKLTDYQNTLRPWVSDQEALDQITSREDSLDPPKLCIQYSCSLGSDWGAKGYTLNNSTFVIDYDGSQAYVVSYGVVRYIGNTYLSDLAGQSSNRSYGILFRKYGDNWKVQRLAAESFGGNYGAGVIKDN